MVCIAFLIATELHIGSRLDAVLPATWHRRTCLALTPARHWFTAYPEVRMAELTWMVGYRHMCQPFRIWRNFYAFDFKFSHSDRNCIYFVLRAAEAHTQWDQSVHIVLLLMLLRFLLQQLQCESKKSPPEVFWHFFPNGWEFLVQILHTYYTFLSVLDYKFLFNFLQLWPVSYTHLTLPTILRV